MSPSRLEQIATLSVPSDPGYLAVSRQALNGAAAGLPISDDDLDDLKLVLSEICANAIIHAYGRRSDGRIDITFRRSERELEVTVSDRGPGFPGGQVPDPVGAGLTLLHRLCSRHSIEPHREAGGAAVTFAQSVIS
jgi:anti-sigma regulatory factor (Ser/Thr protein kinase)